MIVEALMAVQRMTNATERVLRLLVNSETPVWGLQLMRQTGLPSGTIYPMLARLEGYGWIEATWDIEAGPGPRRHLYSITGKGRDAVAQMLAERAVRPARLRGRPSTVTP